MVFNEHNEKIVEFDKWCRICKYLNSSVEEEPCYTCISVATNENSHVPTKFIIDKGAEDPRYKRGGKNDPGYKK